MTATIDKGPGGSSGAEVEPAPGVTLTIDDVQVTVPKGTLVIRAAEQLGIEIPRFCDHPLLEPAGACRQCLVEVATPDKEGNLKPMPKPQASCTLEATPGMVVRTAASSPMALKAQTGVMELLLMNHPLDCPVCDKGGECPLQNQAMTHGRVDSRFIDVKRVFTKPIPVSTQILLDRERCVLCQRCTRFSDEIAGDAFIALQERGAHQQIGRFDEEILGFADSSSHGAPSSSSCGDPSSSSHGNPSSSSCGREAERRISSPPVNPRPEDPAPPVAALPSRRMTGGEAAALPAPRMTGGEHAALPARGMTGGEHAALQAPRTTEGASAVITTSPTSSVTPIGISADDVVGQAAVAADGTPFASYFGGNTVQICPVGALTSAAYRFRARPFDLVSTLGVAEHDSSCAAIRVDHRRGVVVRRLAANDPLVNEEWITDKDRFAFAWQSAPDRLTTPLVREDGALRPASWVEALELAAEGLANAKAAGGVGVLPGGRLTLEDAHAWSRFARTVLGTDDVDQRARVHSAEETAFLARTVAGTGLGVTFADLEAAPAVLLAGFEAEEEGGYLFLRLRKAVRKGTLRVLGLAPFASRGLQRLHGTLLPTAPGLEAEWLDAITASVSAATTPPDTPRAGSAANTPPVVLGEGSAASSPPVVLGGGSAASSPPVGVGVGSAASSPSVILRAGSAATGGAGSSGLGSTGGDEILRSASRPQDDEEGSPQDDEEGSPLDGGASRSQDEEEGSPQDGGASRPQDDEEGSPQVYEEGSPRDDRALRSRDDGTEAARDAAEALVQPGAVIVVGERLAGVPGALSAVLRLAAATGARIAWVPRRVGERGGVEAGLLPGLLPGGRPLTDAAARAEVAAAWGVDEAVLPAAPGRDLQGIVAALREGALAGALVGGVELADLPDPAAAREALAKAAFVVSFEVRASEVTKLADVVLPVAPPVERAGTYVSWEGRPRPFARALASSALPDHRVLHALAAHFGADHGAGNPATALPAWAGQRAAAPDANPSAAPELPAEPGDSTAAVLASWHLLLDDGALQDGEPHLAGTAKKPVARLSAATAAAIDVADGDPVTVSTARGSITLPVRITPMVDHVVWLPLASTGSRVHDRLGAAPGAVVRVTGGIVGGAAEARGGGRAPGRSGTGAMPTREHGGIVGGAAEAGGGGRAPGRSGTGAMPTREHGGAA